MKARLFLLAALFSASGALAAARKHELVVQFFKRK
jgi:hypothetical protein